MNVLENRGRSFVRSRPSSSAVQVIYFDRLSCMRSILNSHGHGLALEECFDFPGNDLTAEEKINDLFTG